MGLFKDNAIFNRPVDFSSTNFKDNSMENLFMNCKTYDQTTNIISSITSIANSFRNSGLSQSVVTFEGENVINLSNGFRDIGQELYPYPDNHKSYINTITIPSTAQDLSGCFMNLYGGKYSTGKVFLNNLTSAVNLAKTFYGMSNIILYDFPNQLPNSILNMEATFYSASNIATEMDLNIYIPKSVTNLENTFFHYTEATGNTNIFLLSEPNINSLNGFLAYASEHINAYVNIPKTVTSLANSFSSFQGKNLFVNGELENSYILDSAFHNLKSVQRCNINFRGKNITSAIDAFSNSEISSNIYINCNNANLSYLLWNSRIFNNIFKIEGNINNGYNIFGGNFQIINGTIDLVNAKFNNINFSIVNQKGFEDSAIIGLPKKSDGAIGFNQLNGWNRVCTFKEDRYNYNAFNNGWKQILYHNFKSEIKKINSCTEEGLSFENCVNCHSYYEKVLRKSLHDFKNNVCTICGFQEENISNKYFTWNESNYLVNIDYTNYYKDCGSLIILPKNIITTNAPIQEVLNDNTFAFDFSKTEIQGNDMSDWFWRQQNLIGFKLNPNIQNLSNTFRGIEEQELPISIPNKVTNMSYSFMSSNISNIEIQKLQGNIGSAFQDCNNLKEINILETGNLTFASYAFCNCKKLTSISNNLVLDFNTSHSAYMFFNCFNLRLNNITFLFNYSSTYTRRNYMFYNTNLDHIYYNGNFTKSREDFSNIFNGVHSINKLGILSDSVNVFYNFNGFNRINRLCLTNQEAVDYINNYNPSLVPKSYGLHNWIQGNIISEATCTIDGKREPSICEFCDYEDYSNIIIQKLGHNFINNVCNRCNKDISSIVLSYNTCKKKYDTLVDYIRSLGINDFSYYSDFNYEAEDIKFIEDKATTCDQLEKIKNDYNELKNKSDNIEKFKKDFENYKSQYDELITYSIEKLNIIIPATLTIALYKNPNYKEDFNNQISEIQNDINELTTYIKERLLEIQGTKEEN